MSNQWLNNICIKRPHNCLNGDKCPHDTDCCFERDNNSGVKGTHGTCVAKGSCNYLTGHPTIHTQGKCPYQESWEGFNDIAKSKSPHDASNCTYFIVVLTFITLVLGSGVVYASLKK